MNEVPTTEFNENSGLRAPRLDRRACGCTVHNIHDGCTWDCIDTHCGYAKDNRTTIHLELESLRHEVSIHQQVETAKLELREWWNELAGTEADQVVAKAIEYGSRDLIDIGHDLARCMGRTVNDQDAAEMGIYFYLRGKLSRWTSAIERGERPSDDTLKDLGVYVRMAQRVRSHGGWPGVKQ